MASLASSALRRTFVRPVHNDGEDCDCGRPKPYALECCESCAFLDGIRLPIGAGRASFRRADVVAALRLCSRMTLVDLATAVYGRVDASTRRMMLKLLRELVRDGRVCVSTDDGDENGTSPRRYSLVGGVVKLTSDISANVLRCDVVACGARFLSYSEHSLLRKQAAEHEGFSRASRARVMRAFDLKPEQLDGGKVVDVCASHRPPSRTRGAS